MQMQGKKVASGKKVKRYKSLAKYQEAEKWKLINRERREQNKTN